MGVSLLGLLSGDFSKTPRTKFYYYYGRNNLEAVRSANWKLVFKHTGRKYNETGFGELGRPGKTDENFSHPQALYNLNTDPGEIYDLQKLFPEKVKELELLAEQARNDLGDDLTKRKGKNNRVAGKAP